MTTTIVSATIKELLRAYFVRCEEDVWQTTLQIVLLCCAEGPDTARAPQDMFVRWIPHTITRGTEQPVLLHVEDDVG